MAVVVVATLAVASVDGADGDNGPLFCCALLRLHCLPFSFARVRGQRQWHRRQCTAAMFNGQVSFSFSWAFFNIHKYSWIGLSSLRGKAFFGSHIRIADFLTLISLSAWTVSYNFQPPRVRYVCVPCKYFSRPSCPPSVANNNINLNNQQILIAKRSDKN